MSNPLPNQTMKRTSQPYFRHSACLRILDVGHLHDEISKKTGLTPTHLHRKGEYYGKKRPKKWKNDVWILDSPLPVSRGLTAHLVWLHKKLSPHKAYLRRLQRQGVKMDIYCGYRSNCDFAGFEIRPAAYGIFRDFSLPFGCCVIIA